MDETPNEWRDLFIFCFNAWEVEKTKKKRRRVKVGGIGRRAAAA
jgi:hypothetical protein